MEDALFNEAGDVLRSLLPRELDDARMKARRYGLKVWFGPTEPAKQHYEAQVVGARYVREATVLALELGFHSEHPKAEDNARSLDALLSSERRCRKALGPEAV